ncbi:MAG: carbamoyltransferase HypF, partial [Lachnospiraceae bacterium]|nr:carbamoyltransferase HypF [Candidatus Minthocola equi]
MIKRAKIRVNGIVQGVGFRPFIHKQITGFSLNGWIRNTSAGAEIELEGEEAAIETFAAELWTKAPQLALIASVKLEYMPDLAGYTEFKIIKSDGNVSRNTLISPDVCICDECLEEMRSPGRRYKYAFINCTNCGPRFTIIKDVPYDRSCTTMAPFKMCPDCYTEYTTITNRRYHAEPTGCNDCGPNLTFVDNSGNQLPGEAIENTVKYIHDKKIVAIKGLGGFHLAGRIDDPEVAITLRHRKHRDEKPFAIMCRDVDTVRKYCSVSDDEEMILTSPKRPIVLLKKRDSKELKHISENGYIGVMLPYTPVHYLICDAGIDAMIMTSANISDLPIVYKNDEALDALSGIADGFLINNREIHVRCDDSLTYVYDGDFYPVRRSRGFVPYPVIMQHDMPQLLACGAEQKASFTLSKGNYAFPSQHIGDMKSAEVYENYCGQIKHFEKLFNIIPEMLICDMHPDYLSTNYAKTRSESDNLPVLQVQHHHAHLASCMADNDLDGETIGIIWDGTGYGEDGTIWGGEFLTGGYKTYNRAGHIRPVKLAGGDLATHNLWRVGIALLLDAGIEPEEYFEADKCNIVKTQLSLGINSPLSSGMGRLFDGVAAILGIKVQGTYEGQGAILLEAAANNNCEKLYDYDIIEDSGYVFDYRKMIKEIAGDVLAGEDVGDIAAAFMNTLVDMAVKITCRISADTGLLRVVLSGGTFNDMYLMNRLPAALKSKGLEVYHHRRVSCGDEGLSLGQIM